MVLSALPPDLQKPENWKGTDQDVWYKRFWIGFRLKWFTFSHRAKEEWARFRRIPKTIFLINGLGSLRYENFDGSKTSMFEEDGYYLSRIQPWIRWHFAIQWPLLIQWHWIYKPEDIANFPQYKSDFGIKKMATGLIGMKRDGDEVYFLTMFLGGNFE